MLELKTEYLFDYCGRVRPFSEWLIAGDGGRGTRVIAPVVSGRSAFWSMTPFTNQLDYSP
jgi:hypothetical protein